MDLAIIKNKVKNNPLLYYIALVPWLPIRFFKCIKRYSFDRRILHENRNRLAVQPIGENDILYFGVPYHVNAGDMAQTFCTRNWLSENFPGQKIHEFNTAALLNTGFLDEIQKQTDYSNMIIFQSGYTSHEKHRDHKMHKMVVQRFKDNKIVFMPQTVNIASEEEMKNTARIFGEHSHLLFIVRDEISYKMVYKEFQHAGVKLLVCPDIVNILVGSDKFSDDSTERSGVLMVMRNDSEKLYDSRDVADIKNALIGLGEDTEITDTTLSDIGYDEFYADFETVFRNLLKKWNRARLVVTDRYHGTIFSAITNTPVIVLASNDHKVIGGYEWFEKEGYTSVYYAKKPDDVIKIAGSILSEYSEVHNSNIFKTKYYDNLKKEIDSV